MVVKKAWIMKKDYYYQVYHKEKYIIPTSFYIMLTVVTWLVLVFTIRSCYSSELKQCILYLFLAFLANIAIWWGGEFLIRHKCYLYPMQRHTIWIFFLVSGLLYC